MKEGCLLRLAQSLSLKAQLSSQRLPQEPQSRVAASFTLMINLPQYYLVALTRECRGSLEHPACRDSFNAKPCFTPACEHGLAERENEEEKGCKGIIKAVAVIVLQPLNRVWSPSGSHIREIFRAEGRNSHVQFVFKFCTHLYICSIIVCSGFTELEIRTKFSSML